MRIVSTPASSRVTSAVSKRFWYSCSSMAPPHLSPCRPPVGSFCARLLSSSDFLVPPTRRERRRRPTSRQAPGGRHDPVRADGAHHPALAVLHPRPPAVD